MSVRKVRVRSLAKINLDLQVLNKRPDGFHELRTIFQTVSLADRLEIAFTPGKTSSILLNSEVDIPDNLVLRATDLILQATGKLEFRLTKAIPMGGGLGGGSSNAAAVLLTLPVLTGRIIPLHELLELASRLGSDVPFFLLGGAALGLGRGTELYPCLEPHEKAALLITPGLHVSTPEAYRGLARALTGEVPSRIINSFQALAWRMGDGRPTRSWEVGNDFETVVFSQHPQLLKIKGKLVELGADLALMSGSGSTVFGVFERIEERDRAAADMENELGAEKVHRVSFVKRSRYQAMWKRQLSAHLDQTGVWPPQSRY